MPAAPFGELNWQLRQDSNRLRCTEERSSDYFLPAVFGIRLSPSTALQNELFAWLRRLNEYQLSLIHPQ